MKYAHVFLKESYSRVDSSPTLCSRYHLHLWHLNVKKSETLTKIPYFLKILTS